LESRLCDIVAFSPSISHPTSAIGIRARNIEETTLSLLPQGKRKKERAARLAVTPVLAARGKRENHSEGIKNPRMSTISDISANFFSGHLRERYHSVTFPKKVHARIIPRIIPRISLNAMVLLPAIHMWWREGKGALRSARNRVNGKILRLHFRNKLRPRFRGTEAVRSTFLFFEKFAFFLAPGGRRTRARICKKFPRLAASKSGLRNFANGVTLRDQASVSARWDYYSVIREREGRRFHTKRETRSLPVSCVKIEKSPVLSRHFLRAIHFTARS